MLDGNVNRQGDLSVKAAVTCVTLHMPLQFRICLQKKICTDKANWSAEKKPKRS